MKTPKPKQIKLTEIAERIQAHLKRIEADPKLNPGRTYDKVLHIHVLDPKGTHDFYYARAFVIGSFVQVIYVNYQSRSSLRREEALKYLAWLDAGNNGKHWSALK